MAEMWPRCGRDVAEMWPRCGRDVAEMWPGCSRDLADTTQAGLHVRGAKRRSGALLALRQAGGRLDGDCFRLWCRRGSRCALLAAAATLALAIDERRAPIQRGGRLLRGGKVRLSTHTRVW